MNKSNQNNLLLLGLGALAILLIAIIFIGTGILIGNNSGNETTKTGNSIANTGQPTISPITFSNGSRSAVSFEEGITSIHAIFEYTNMSNDLTWERVWYLDDKEILRNSESWTDDKNGSLDRPLDNNGVPLNAGKWTLEIYVESNLLATGSFFIKSKTDTLPTAKPTSKPAANVDILPTAKSTSKPAARVDILPTAKPTSKPTRTPMPKPRRKPPTRTPTPTRKPAPVRARVYQLVYSKWDGMFQNLFIADTNGNNETFIISRAAGPSWSPNGRQVFFYGEQGINQQMRDNNTRLVCDFRTISGGIVAIDLPTPLGDICDVYYGNWLCERKQIDIKSPPSDVCEENGIKVFQNLDWKEGSARYASVAPDGSAVAYDGKPGNNRTIYFRDIFDTTQQFRFELIGEQQDWSPNSQKLVYRSGRDNKQGLWISNRDDSGHTLITNTGTDSFPAFSPNGRTVAFSRDVGGNVDIYTINSDGSNLKQLTNAPGQDALPVYTPGGEIIFRSARTGSWGIWKMSGNGANQKEIIPNAGVAGDWAYSKMDVR